MTDYDLPDDLLLAALRGTNASEEHLDDATTAALLDSRLQDAERQAVEAHLADCASCRELALEAAAAVAEAGGQELGKVLRPDPALWRRRRQALAAMAAAVVLAVLTLTVFSRLASPALESVGVTAEEIERAPSTLRRDARLAFAGTVAPPAGLPSAALLAADGVLRAAGDPTAAVLLAPRWSAIAHGRPLFQWRAAGPSESSELLLVDEEERLVLTLEAPGRDEGGIHEVELPAGVELTPGMVYLWKVNVGTGDGLGSSGWAPFRVLEVDEALALEASLAPAGGDAFLEASTLAAAGLLGAALDALERVPASEEGRRITGRLARALLERQSLSRDEVEHELTRRLGDG